VNEKSGAFIWYSPLPALLAGWVPGTMIAAVTCATFTRISAETLGSPRVVSKQSLVVMDCLEMKSYAKDI